MIKIRQTAVETVSVSEEAHIPLDAAVETHERRGQRFCACRKVESRQTGVQ